MTKEARLIAWIFALYLLYGLLNLIDVQERFIAPSILDPYILLGVSLYFLLSSSKIRSRKNIFLTLGILYSLMIILIYPEALIVFGVDRNLLEYYYHMYGSKIIRISRIVYFIFYGSVVIWCVLKLRKPDLQYGRLEIILLLSGALMLIPVFIFKWSTFFLDVAILVGAYTIIKKNQNTLFLSESDYRFILFLVLIGILSLFELISISGLVQIA